MIWADVNAASVPLQAYALTPDGQPKLDVVSGTVRVYHLDSGVEVVDLPAASLVNVHTNLWRYDWAPAALPPGGYVAEFHMIDADGLSTRFGEDIAVKDYALQSTLLLLAADLELVRKVETGRWKIVNNQMTFYDDDGVTALLVFNLRNEAGVPAMDDVFERVPV